MNYNNATLEYEKPGPKIALNQIKSSDLNVMKDIQNNNYQANFGKN